MTGSRVRPHPRPPTLGLAVTTIGRPELAELLQSCARSTRRPDLVVVANQHDGPLPLPEDLPFPVTVVASSGGASAGRNDALRVLGDRVDVVGFPNDDSSFPPTALAAVAEAFTGRCPPTGVACLLLEPEGERFVLPPPGRPLDRRTVWRAIEPALFLSREAVQGVSAFRTDLGTGAVGSPWLSGEGTDLLLRLMEAGGTVLSRPDIVVHGQGERRALHDDLLVAKHRAYARGTGYVYRLHGYPLHAKLRTLAGPLVRATRHDASLRLSLRIALARSLGRLEGLLGRPLPGAQELPDWHRGARRRRRRTPAPDRPGDV